VQRQDVGVRETGGDLDLLQEPLGPEDGRELGMEDLDRHLAMVLQIICEIDGGHAPAAQLALGLVPPGKRRVQLVDHLEPRLACVRRARTDPGYNRRVGISIP